LIIKGEINMNVVTEEENKDVMLKVGDIVKAGNDIYILMDTLREINDEPEYEFRTLCGRFGACGTNTLKGMSEWVENNKLTIYSSGEYELLLAKKK
jgi:hypothetical protein